MSAIRILRWSEHGRSVLALTPGPVPGLAEEPAPAGLDLPGAAGIAVLDDPDGWLDTGAAPLGAALYTGPGLDALLDAVADGRTDAHAPTQAAGEIRIDADPHTVWSVLADVASWPHVRGDVHSVESDGPARPGGAFTWSAGPNRIASTFAAVEPGRLLTYASTSAGAHFTHVYRTAPAADGTLLSCEETLAGPVIAALVPSAALQAGVDTWLAGVKAVAEAR
ncbi:Polyketide cyclase / dehydrase and lipid transport [Glycomyces sambucus]|uniref:Polyketide cyclase / dehydrase and lipid transport n=1 Tax=Glycomyces sambucus TaxID=380244 RepID=A0A1G9EYR2_9ACTN|nr:SRPBCC family protein [Glycomyces sambucus]SDK81309.1 Polyketide cyclase / dehydrase and lipid transport [Glycomyces sambucus]